MYTSGWPKNQKRCCQSSGSPPCWAMKKGQPNARSSSSRRVPRITGGKAKMTMPPTTSMAHAKIGMRPSDMPGARVRRIPTMSSIAPAMAEISMKPIPSSQKSAPTPGREAGARERRVHEPPAVRRPADEEGSEERQAADGVGPEGVGVQARERQVPRAQHPGQEIDAHRLHDRHREQEHHHAAVHGEDLVVRVGAHQRVPRHRELRADDQREDAAEHEEQERGPEVEEPDARVVHVGERSPASRRLPHRLQRGAARPEGPRERIGTRSPEAREIRGDGVEGRAVQVPRTTASGCRA